MTNTPWTEAQHARMRAVIFKHANKGTNPVAAASIMFEALDAAWDEPGPVDQALSVHFVGRLYSDLLKEATKNA